MKDPLTLTLSPKMGERAAVRESSDWVFHRIRDYLGNTASEHEDTDLLSQIRGTPSLCPMEA